ncbi:MAG TPA: hypothetical protein VFT45_11330 [Longimicrobium sp.]|nr:hypothetical protein [Longimicrobium sp.]
MTDIAQNSGPVEAREAAHLEVEDLLNRAREAVARSREILESSRQAVGSAMEPAPSPADRGADAV